MDLRSNWKSARVGGVAEIEYQIFAIEVAEKFDFLERTRFRRGICSH